MFLEPLQHLVLDPATSLPDAGIENLFLDVGVDGELAADPRDQLLLGDDRSTAQGVVLGEERVDLIVVGLEQRDGIGRCGHGSLLGGDRSGVLWGL
jgi:hypothetical protein